MCFEGIARLSRRVWRRFVRGSREISLVPSLHRASTDALIYLIASVPAHHTYSTRVLVCLAWWAALLSQYNTPPFTIGKVYEGSSYYNRAQELKGVKLVSNRITTGM